MSGHIDTETLSAFTGGALRGYRAARVRAHLSGCARCTEISEQLAMVSAALAAAPTPPMPAGLAARLDAALAAETARAAEMAEPAATVPAVHPGARRQAGRPGGRYRLALLRTAAVAATVAVVGGAGYGVVTLLRAGGGSSAGSAGTGASGPAYGSARSQQPSASLPQHGAAAGLPVIASGTDYQPGQVRAQVRAVIRSHHPVPGASGAAAIPGPGPTASGFPALPACIAAVTGGRQPQLVDVARYRGRPVAVIVVPAHGGTTVRVWVVGTGCGRSGGDVITRFSLPGVG